MAKLSQVSNKKALELVQDVQKHDGWLFIKEIMQDEIMTAANKLAETPQMSLEELHFRRGAMWAARKLIDVPTVLASKLENDVAMEVLQAEEVYNNTKTK
tara:strand:+ start:229 stop:528 length:300 start_codon:yes stop_codon:yes gene_type:complete